MSYWIWVNDFEPMIVNQWIWDKCLGEVSGGSFWVSEFLNFWIYEFLNFCIFESEFLMLWFSESLKSWIWINESEPMNLSQRIWGKCLGEVFWGKLFMGSFWGKFLIFEFLNVWISKCLNFWIFEFLKLNFWIAEFLNLLIFEFFEFLNFCIFEFFKLVTQQNLSIQCFLFLQEIIFLLQGSKIYPSWNKQKNNRCSRWKSFCFF